MYYCNKCLSKLEDSGWCQGCNEYIEPADMLDTYAYEQVLADINCEL